MIKVILIRFQKIIFRTTFFSIVIIASFIGLRSIQASTSDPIQNVFFGQDSSGDYISFDWVTSTSSLPPGSTDCNENIVAVWFNRYNPNGTSSINYAGLYDEDITGDLKYNIDSSYGGLGKFGFTSGSVGGCGANPFFDQNLSSSLPRTIKAYINPGVPPNKISFSSSDFITIQIIELTNTSSNAQVNYDDPVKHFYTTPTNPLPVIPFQNPKLYYNASNKLMVSFDWIGKTRAVNLLAGINAQIIFDQGDPNPNRVGIDLDPNHDLAVNLEAGGNFDINYAYPLAKSIIFTPGSHYELPVNALHRRQPTIGLADCKYAYGDSCPISQADSESFLGRKLNANDYLTLSFGDLNVPYSFMDPNKYYYNSPEPVIFIPGILGTKLNKVSNNEEVWPGNLLLPFDFHLNFLSLSTSSTELPNQLIKTNEILDQATLGFNVYRDILEKLTSYAEQNNVPLYQNPYDWRRDLSKTALDFGKIIQAADASSTTQKTDVVVHSMGGLLLKEYLRTANTTNNIDKIVFLGTPHLGAIKAAKVLLYGDSLGIPVLNAERARVITQNSPAVYELLPSRKYSNISGSYIVDNRSSNQDTTKALSFASTTQFLKDFGLNHTLVDRASTFHDALDNYSLPASTTVYNIVGCGNTDTIGKITVLDHDKKTISYTLGDKTVPLESAVAVTSSKRYYSKASHANLVKDTGVLNQIENILNNHPDTIADGVSTSSAFCAFDKKIAFATHSPVTLDIYDSQNNHLGPNALGDIEYGIPDSSYDIIGDNNFVTVPDSATNTYRVVIKAYATGTFDFDIGQLTGSELTKRTSYLNQPLVTTSTTATLSYTSGIDNALLSIDNEGNGSIDGTVSPTATVSGTDVRDITPPDITYSFPPNFEIARGLYPIFLMPSATDSESGLSSLTTYLDEKILGVPALSLISMPLGVHELRFLAYDKAGNPREKKQIFFHYADATSTLTDVQIAFNNDWIKKSEVKNDFKSTLNTIIKLEKRIFDLRAKIPANQIAKLTSAQIAILQAEKIQATISRKAAANFIDELDRKLKSGAITIEAYLLLKEDVQWLTQ